MVNTAKDEDEEEEKAAQNKHCVNGGKMFHR